MAKEAYYFSHDSNARHDPKITAMRGVYGSEGYGWYWMLIEMMRESDDYKLDMQGKYVWNAYAMQLHAKSDAIASFVNDCINEFELFSSDDNYFWSNSLLKRMELRDERSEKAKKAAEARWSKSPKMLKAMRMHQKDANAVDNDALKESKRKESKGKEIKENNNYSESLSFFTSEFSLMPSPFMVEQLNELIDQYTDEWVLKALQVSLISGKRDLRYVTGILNKWKSNGLSEPWNEKQREKPNQRNGKPNIPTVSNSSDSDPISDEELSEIMALARKIDGG